MNLHLFGASASGVTTLGRALADTLHIPYFDSDDYFWVKTDPPFTLRREPDERNALIQAELQQAGDWILGGSVINWGEGVFPKFDLVVFLYIDQETRLERLRKREFERYGDVIFSEPERKRQYEEFIAWAADYDDHSGIARRTLNAHRQWLAQTDFPTLEINGDFSVEERVALVIKRLREENWGAV